MVANKPAARICLSLFCALILINLNPTLSQAWQVVDWTRIPGGSTLLAANGESAWCGFSSGQDSTLLVVNVATGEVTQRIRTPEAICRGLAYRGETLWIIGARNYYRLSLNGQVERMFDNPYPSMRCLAGSEVGLWTVERHDGVTSLAHFRLDGTEIQRFPINVVEPGDIAWDGRFIWLTDPLRNSIHKIDPLQGQTVAIYPTPAVRPSGISHFNEHLYLVDYGDEQAGDVLYRIATESEPAPRILPSSRHADFGLINVNIPTQWNFTIFNIGNADLRVDSVNLARNNAGFRIARVQPGTIVRAGMFILVQVTFTPTTYIRFSDTLLIYSNDPYEPLLRVGLFGQGIWPHRRLGVWPDSVDFGVVRADPWRDGCRRAELHLINQGRDDLTVDSIFNLVRDIFTITKPAMPIVIRAADTVDFSVTFTPHRSINYLDTVIVRSNDQFRYYYVFLRGQGSDSVYSAGQILWSYQTSANSAFAIAPDLDRNAVPEIAIVEGNGDIGCFNGFASGEMEALWRLRLGNLNYWTPVGALGCLAAGVSLNSNLTGDIVFGTHMYEESAGAVYGLDGVSGRLLWRWSAGDGFQAGSALRICTEYDINGDSNVDPLTLYMENESDDSYIICLDGFTGRTVWTQTAGNSQILEPVGDLNYDGCVDYIAAQPDGSAYLCDGYDGGLIETLDLGASRLIEPVKTHIGQPTKTILVAGANGGVQLFDLERSRPIWSIDTNPPGAQFGIIQRLMCLSFLGQGWQDKFIFSSQRVLIYIDRSAEFQVIWTFRLNADITALAALPATRNENSPSLIAGLLDGTVVCLSLAEHSERWRFQGVGGVIRLQLFVDVDFGGSADIIAQFANGRIVCISSGGDLAVDPEAGFATPAALGFISLSPNPFNRTANIYYNLPIGQSGHIVIFDAAGRAVAHYPLANHTGFVSLEEIQTDNLSNGIYIFKLESSYGSTATRGVMLK